MSAPLPASPHPSGAGNPPRWQVGASLVPPFALAWVACRQHWLPVAPGYALAAMAAAFALGTAFAPVFLPWYRGFHRCQGWLGRRLLALMLGLVHLTLVLPLGCILRATGRSFLAPRPGSSNWHPARPAGSLRDPF